MTRRRHTHSQRRTSPNRTPPDLRCRRDVACVGGASHVLTSRPADPPLRFRPRPAGLADDVKELRLAVVCYGGVSLAIYMHGITKELQKLVETSRRFELDPSHNPFAEGSVEHAYFQALRRTRERDGLTTRVVVDVVSGTSAGGINGICLAKALARQPLAGAAAGALAGQRRHQEAHASPRAPDRLAQVRRVGAVGAREAPLRADAAATPGRRPDVPAAPAGAGGDGGNAAGGGVRRAGDAHAGGARARAVRHDHRLHGHGAFAPRVFAQDRLRPGAPPRARVPVAPPRSVRRRRPTPSWPSRRAPRRAFRARSHRSTWRTSSATFRTGRANSGSSTSSSARTWRRAPRCTGATSWTAACWTTSRSTMPSTRSSTRRRTFRSTAASSTSSPTRRNPSRG